MESFEEVKLLDEADKKSYVAFKHDFAEITLVQIFDGEYSVRLRRKQDESLEAFTYKLIRLSNSLVKFINIIGNRTSQENGVPFDDESTKMDPAQEIKGVRPAIGIKPRKIHELERRDDLATTIVRYASLNLPVQKEWVDEYNELNNKYVK